jgi:hypothetical protein
MGRLFPNQQGDIVMKAIRMPDPESRRFIRTSWQFPLSSLQLKKSTTGGMKTSDNPQAMGEAAWH